MNKGNSSEFYHLELTSYEDVVCSTALGQSLLLMLFWTQEVVSAQVGDVVVSVG